MPRSYSPSFLSSITTADIINVPDDQPTIQAGIVAAMNGDEVVVAPGTYNELINFLGKAITVRSTDGPAATVIDGTSLNNSVVKCVSGEGRDTVLDGFTITGGNTVRGGGVACNEASPTLINLLLVANSATQTNGEGFEGLGGGVSSLHGDPLLLKCVFDGNVAGAGGGLGLGGTGQAEMFACMFRNDLANAGGGIQLNTLTAISATNCLLVENESTQESGGALMAVDSSHALIINSTLVGNISSFGGPIRTRDHASVTIVNVIVRNNTPVELQANAIVEYSNIEGGFPGAGNIDADPMFVDSDNNNFRLSDGSPCMDAGDNTIVPEDVHTDIAGQPRFVDDPSTVDTGIGDPPIVDMGAHEYQPPIPVTIVSTESRLVHDRGGPNEIELSIDLMDSGGIEPRDDGPKTLAFEMSEEMDADTVLPEHVQINCSAHDPSVIAFTTFEGSSVVVVDLLDGLVDIDCCTFSFDGILGVNGGVVVDTFDVVPLQGDLDFSRGVSGGDAALIKPHVGEIAGVDLSEPWWDFDVSGGVTGGDFSLIKTRFNTVAPECP